MGKVTKNMTIAEVLEQNKRYKDVLMGFGMHCFSCPERSSHCSAFGGHFVHSTEDRNLSQRSQPGFTHC